MMNDIIEGLILLIIILDYYELIKLKLKIIL